ncbi:hypothetical protein ACFX13_026341 [Malus domestica]
MTFRPLSLHFLIRSSHLSRLRQVFGKTWSTTDKSFSPAATFPGSPAAKKLSAMRMLMMRSGRNRDAADSSSAFNTFNPFVVCGGVTPCLRKFHVVQWLG